MASKPMTNYSVISARIDDNLKNRLAAYCRNTGRSVVYVVNKSVQAYLDKEEKGQK